MQSTWCLLVALLPYLAQARLRTYYIAAVEVDWDYAPSGRDLVFSPSQSNQYLATAADRIGRIYKKAIYKQYTDASYSHEIQKPVWLGLVGPIIHVEVGDTLFIYYRNFASHKFSIHPHGVRYLKDQEGALYLDNTFGTNKKDENVGPGESYLYQWNVTDNFGPAASDPNCITWVYHSHINTPSDTNAGLIGPLITCKKGTLNPDGTRKDVSKEFVLLAKIYDENMSFYAAQNRKKCWDQKKCDKLAVDEDEDYMDSNQMRSINGYLFGNGPPFIVNAGESVVWHIIGMGNEAGIHTLHFNGQILHMEGRTESIIEAMQASFRTASMTPGNPGRWLISCTVSEHYRNGMNAFLDIRPSTYQNYYMTPTGNVRQYYLSVEEVEWDYAPSGMNKFKGVPLIDNLETEGMFTSGQHRIGRRYLKARFFQYQNSSYTLKSNRSAGEQHLGILGPIIQVEEGDTVRISLKNLASRSYSFLPYGVFYKKSEEGAVYMNGGLVQGKVTKPGQIQTYTFLAPRLTTDDPDCKMFPYQSAVNAVRDFNTGLVGPLVICKKGYIYWNYLRDHRAFYLLFTTFDENLSWYLTKNIQKYTTDPQGVDTTNAAFIASNQMHVINGYAFANLPGLDTCIGDHVVWNLFSMGNEIDIHSVYFHGNTFSDNGVRGDTRGMLASTSYSVNMVISNPGIWGLVCRTTIHAKAGMKALYNAKVCPWPRYHIPYEHYTHGLRRYYIAAEEIEWEYVPKKRSLITGNDLHNLDEDGNIYIRNTNMFVGSVYKKAVFREYTDSTFTKRVTRDSSTEHLGLLGPLIKAEIHETIEIVFRNKASRPYSIHPHGLMYTKDNEGQMYNDHRKGTKGAQVMPNTTYHYVWKVPSTAGPGPNDPNCIVWEYYSATDPIKDVYSGLIGPLIVCRPNILDNEGKRRDVDKEFALLFFVEDENQSWYFKENIANKAPGRVNTDYGGDDDFEESNLFHSINGLIFGNNQGLIMRVGEKAAWYLMSYGSDKDVHTAHFHGQTFLHTHVGKHRSDVITLTPSTSQSVEFLADNPGTWILHCHVNDHIIAGMETVYTILPKKRSHRVY